MARNAEEVVVTGDAAIYVAPLGTSVPAYADTPTGAWVELGYVKTDGVEFSFNRETKDIETLQSFDPLRTITTKVPKTFKASLQQFNPDVLALAFGGGSWAESDTEPGVFEYTAPEAAETDERAVIVDLSDGTEKFRFIFPRAINKAGITFKATKEEEVAFPVEMSVLQPATGAAYTVQTDSTVFEPAS